MAMILETVQSYALDQYATLIGNRIGRIEWYLQPCGRLRLPEVPEIAFGTREFGPEYRVERLAFHAI